MLSSQKVLRNRVYKRHLLGGVPPPFPPSLHGAAHTRAVDLRCVQEPDNNQKKCSARTRARTRKRSGVLVGPCSCPTDSQALPAVRSVFAHSSAPLMSYSLQASPTRSCTTSYSAQASLQRAVSLGAVSSNVKSCSSRKGCCMHESSDQCYLHCVPDLPATAYGQCRIIGPQAPPLRFPRRGQSMSTAPAGRHHPEMP